MGELLSATRARLPRARQRCRDENPLLASLTSLLGSPRASRERSQPGETSAGPETEARTEARRVVPQGRLTLQKLSPNTAAIARTSVQTGTTAPEAGRMPGMYGKGERKTLLAVRSRIVHARRGKQPGLTGLDPRSPRVTAGRRRQTLFCRGPAAAKALVQAVPCKFCRAESDGVWTGLSRRSVRGTLGASRREQHALRDRPGPPKRAPRRETESSRVAWARRGVSRDDGVPVL